MYDAGVLSFNHESLLLIQVLTMIDFGVFKPFTMYRSKCYDVVRTTNTNGFEQIMG